MLRTEIEQPYCPSLKLLELIENLRVALLSEFKTLRTEIENLRMKLENEAQKKHDAMRLLSKDQADIQLWKS